MTRIDVESILTGPSSAGSGVRGLSREAITINEAALTAAREEVEQHSLSGDEVRRLLGGISRQTLQADVAARQLLALRMANMSWFPSWQFGDDGMPHARLRELIARLPDDVLSADRIMCAPLAEECGRSAADLLAAGEVDRAIHYAYTAGGNR